MAITSNKYVTLLYDVAKEYINVTYKHQIVPITQYL